MQELWGRCPKCGEWFVIDDPDLDALYLCPTHLLPAAVTRWRYAQDEIHTIDRSAPPGGV
jgi:hypothetical protein